VTGADQNKPRTKSQKTKENKEAEKGAKPKSVLEGELDPAKKEEFLQWRGVSS